MKSQPSDSVACGLKTIDQVNFYRSLRNKWRTVSTYIDKRAIRNLKTSQDHLDAVRRIESEKLSGEQVIERATRLWYMEKLIKQARIFDDGAFLLKDTSLEKFAPILHVGWGMDKILELGYDFPGFEDGIKKSANPKFRFLAIEPIGFLYVIGQTPLRSSLAGIRGPSLPAKDVLESFFGQFTETEIRNISHGLGRGTYFQVLSLSAAVRKGLRCPGLFNPLFIMKGIAFAYTMVNCSQLAKVFETAESLTTHNGDREEIRYFKEGIQSALGFLEWNFPGLLETLDHNFYSGGAREIHNAHRISGGIYQF
jgi:hypothetical protein